MNRLFDEPLAVFTDKMLNPELQGMEEFVDGINNIVEAQKKVALQYFEEGSIEAAIPPLKILLHIMAYGNYEGKNITNSELRKQFKREFVIQQQWYKERLLKKQKKDIVFYHNQIQYLEEFLKNEKNKELIADMQIKSLLENARKYLKYIESEQYLDNLVGTIGIDPLFKK